MKQRILHDLVALTELKKEATPGLPLRFEFYLYFPTKEAAEQAAAQLRGEEFAVQVEPSSEGDDWFVLAQLVIASRCGPARRPSRAPREHRGVDGWGVRRLGG